MNSIALKHMLQKGQKMYHIKKDKRSKKSAQIICESLASLMYQKTYYDISISDICHKCGIARTTFYRLFDTIDDVLLYQFDTLFEESLREYTSQDLSLKNQSYAKIILSIVLNNRPLIQAITSSGRSDLFDFSTRKKENIIVQNMNLNINKKERMYCTPMLNAMIFAVIKTWISNGCQETADELYLIIKKNVKRIEEYC